MVSPPWLHLQSALICCKGPRAAARVRDGRSFHQQRPCSEASCEGGGEATGVRSGLKARKASTVDGPHAIVQAKQDLPSSPAPPPPLPQYKEKVSQSEPFPSVLQPWCQGPPKPPKAFAHMISSCDTRRGSHPLPS